MNITLNIPENTGTKALIGEVEKATGFRYLRIAKRHDGLGWVIYRRYIKERGETQDQNKWASDFIGQINNDGKVYITKVTEAVKNAMIASGVTPPSCTVNPANLPEEKERAEAPPEDGATEPAADTNPLDAGEGSEEQ